MIKLFLKKESDWQKTKKQYVSLHKTRDLNNESESKIIPDHTKLKGPDFDHFHSLNKLVCLILKYMCRLH